MTQQRVPGKTVTVHVGFDLLIFPIAVMRGDTSLPLNRFMRLSEVFRGHRKRPVP